MLEIRSDSKTVVDRVHGHANLKVTGKYKCDSPESSVDVVEPRI